MSEETLIKIILAFKNANSILVNGSLLLEKAEITGTTVKLLWHNESNNLTNIIFTEDNIKNAYEENGTWKIIDNEGDLVSVSFF